MYEVHMFTIFNLLSIEYNEITMTEVEAVLGKLKEIGHDLGKERVADALANILKDLSKNGGKMHTILTQLGCIGFGVKNMLDGDIGTKLIGLNSVVSAIQVLAPVFERPAKEFANFICSIFSSTDRNSSDVLCHGSLRGASAIDMLAKVISGTHDSYGYDVMKADVDGACRVFSFAHHVLIGVSSDSDECPNRREISDVINTIGINNGVNTLGKIASRIVSLMENEPTTQSERELSMYSERVIKYIDMYCHLAILRDAVMLEFYALLISSGHSDRLAKGVTEGMEGEHERDRNLMKSLVLPNQKHVRFASFFDPDRWPFTFKFIEGYKDFYTMDNLDKVPVVMNTVKWMNWFATHDTKPAVCLRSLKSSLERPLDKLKHNFVLLKKEGSSCYYICPQGKKDMYVVMRNDDKKWVEVRRGKPGKEGEWNLFNVQDKDSVYILSTRRWPVHFLSMSDTWLGWIHGKTASVSDPSVQWIIQYNGSRA
ncbi:toxin CaTX-A-like [Ylistrum balloti]|uniref:toxin CaTX-A-like n=1 Tax=Ylistrum balloti TaxID=509963 RepID=UPI002905EC11|nr:toxin CaTX-A-like [Ylistrum balloti]